MIDRFFRQNNGTIMDFLSQIGKDTEVFSCFSGMELEKYIVLFYAIKTEIVLVCLDIVDEGTVEYADKGVYENWRKENTYKYFRRVLSDGTISKDYRDRRMSPVAQLYSHACQMRKFFALSRQFSLVPAIHLMYLTNSRIVNYPKVVRTWQQNLFGFSALQNLPVSKSFDYRYIPINNDLNLEWSAYWTKWQTYLKNRGWFDWANPLYDDWPPPSDKRYSWKPEMGHLISDEFEE